MSKNYASLTYSKICKTPGFVLAEFCPKAFEKIQPDGEIIRYTCQSPRCSIECYKYWAKVNLYGMLWSFQYWKTPDWTLRLAAKNLSDDLTTEAEKKACRAFKSMGFEYGGIREWQRFCFGRHLHLLLMTCGKGITGPEVADVWMTCVGKKHYLDCYSEPIHDLGNLTRYLLKYGDGKIVIPPPDFKGNVFIRSRGFLQGQVKQLYRASAAAFWAGKDKSGS